MIAVRLFSVSDKHTHRRDSEAIKPTEGLIENSPMKAAAAIRESMGQPSPFAGLRRPTTASGGSFNKEYGENGEGGRCN